MALMIDLFSLSSDFDPPGEVRPAAFPTTVVDALQNGAPIAAQK
jgi:hypothetical protein